MKKLFSLVLVVTMLAFAGSAMAAVTLTATPATLSLSAGTTATSTLTAAGVEDNLGPDWSFDLGASAPSWASLTGTGKTRTLTVAPGASVTGNFTITATVTCKYKSAVHGGTTTETANATVTVTVTSAQPTPPSPTPTDPTKPTVVPITIIETVEVVARQVKVIAPQYANAIKAEVFTKISSNQLNIRQTMPSITTALRSIVSDVPLSATLMEPTNVTVVESTNYTGDVETDLRFASGRLKLMSGGDSKRAIATMPSFKAAESGLQAFDFPAFNPVLYGQTIGMVMSKRTTVIETGEASFNAADEKGNNDAVFLDSKGKQITKIPGVKTKSDDPEPGIVTAIVYVEAGKTYDPIVTTDANDTLDSVLGTSTVASVTVVETVETTVNVYETSTFSPMVEDSARVAIASALGMASKDLYTFDYDAAKDGEWTLSSEERTYMSANDIYEVALLPSLKASKAGLYVATITFDNTAPSATRYVGPDFYADGVLGDEAVSSLYVVNGNTATLLSDTNVSKGNTAYLVVEIGESGAVTSDTDVEAAAATLTKPTVAIRAVDVVGVGSSSSGCSAGSAVLALAVLGTFIASRKK